MMPDIDKVGRLLGNVWMGLFSVLKGFDKRHPVDHMTVDPAFNYSDVTC